MCSPPLVRYVGMRLNTLEEVRTVGAIAHMLLAFCCSNKRKGGKGVNGLVSQLMTMV